MENRHRLKNFLIQISHHIKGRLKMRSKYQPKMLQYAYMVKVNDVQKNNSCCSKCDYKKCPYRKDKTIKAE